MSCFSAVSSVGILHFVGLKNIQTWTKESFRQPPFNLVNYIDWTSPPSKAVRLKDVYTKPSYRQIYRTMYGVENKHLDDISNILDTEEFSLGSPVRILLQDALFPEETRLKYRFN